MLLDHLDPISLSHLDSQSLGELDKKALAQLDAETLAQLDNTILAQLNTTDAPSFESRLLIANARAGKSATPPNPSDDSAPEPGGPGTTPPQHEQELEH